MKDFIDLLLIGALGYVIIKYALKFIVKKVRWMLLDKDAIVEEERMRYKNTIYANEFSSMEFKLMSRGFNDKGIYIFTNIDNNKTYVGQSVNILRRVKQHLTGRGNEDLFRDYEKGNKFTVKFIKLKDTDFKTLMHLRSITSQRTIVIIQDTIRPRVIASKRRYKYA